MATLYLTSPELSSAVEQLEGVRLPSRTLGSWASSALLVPSIDWAQTQRVPRLYSLRDLARARLLVRLRQARFGAARVRVIMAHIDQHERDVFSERTRAVLTVDGWRTEVRIQRPGEPARSVPSGQLVLPLSDVMNGNLEVVKGFRNAA
jgi:DNA-binding transcriptional MerR regulator